LKVTPSEGPNGIWVLKKNFDIIIDSIEAKFVKSEEENKAGVTPRRPAEEKQLTQFLT
jgi:hypothetical protein